jgi:hypothetical protein
MPRPRFTPGERTPGTHWTGGWVGLRAELDQTLKQKFFASDGDQTPVVQSVVKHYTDWATPAIGYYSYLASLSLVVYFYKFMLYAFVARMLGLDSIMMTEDYEC